MNGIRQHDMRDCGSACLAKILRHYRSFVPMVKIREIMHVDKNGASMFAVCAAADYFGLEAQGLKGSVTEILKERDEKNVAFPLIAHILTDENQFHYVVVKKIKDKYVHIFDPAKGNRRFKICDFEELFTGFFINLVPKEDFSPEKRTRKPYEKFANIVFKQKTLFSSAILLSVLLAGLSIFTSFAYQTIVDKYILNNNHAMELRDIPIFSKLYIHIEELCHSLPQLFVAVLFIYLSQTLIFALRGIIITYIYKNSSNMLITNYCRKLIQLPIPFFHDRETGEILSRYNDIEEIQNIISVIGLSVIMDVVMAIAGGAVLFVISPELFKIVVIMAIVYALIAFCYRKPIGRISRSIMEADSRLMSKMKETIDGIESIKATCAENKSEEKLSSRIDEYIRMMKRGTLISLSQSTIMSLSQSMGNLAILYFGCNFILNGTISLGTFISFETLIFFFLSPLQNLLSMQITLQQAFVAADRLNDVMENKTENEVFKGKETFKSNEHTCLKVTDLSFSYGYRAPVLQNLDLVACEGEKIAVVGKSGCGKTTLFHILGMIESDYEGCICINDCNIQDIDKTSYRRHVMYVPQESVIFAESFKDNILMGETADNAKLKKIIEGCHLEDVISQYDNGIEAILEENGKNLSGGQKQRIAIARALIKNPKILLLDESTSHLDAEMEKSIFNFISSEFADTTCLFSTHRESLINLCDRKVHILNGKVV